MNEKKKKDNKHKFLKIYLIGVLIWTIGVLIAYYRQNKSLSAYHLSLIKEDRVLEEKIGTIKSMNKNMFYYGTTKGEFNEITYKITNTNNEEYKVKLIIKKEKIYAYEVDGEIIYANNEESIENN